MNILFMLISIYGLEYQANSMFLYVILVCCLINGFIAYTAINGWENNGIGDYKFQFEGHIAYAVISNIILMLTSVIYLLNGYTIIPLTMIGIAVLTIFSWIKFKFKI